MSRLSPILSEQPGWGKGGRGPRVCIPALPRPLRISRDLPHLGVRLAGSFRLGRRGSGSLSASSFLLSDLSVSCCCRPSHFRQVGTGPHLPSFLGCLWPGDLQTTCSWGIGGRGPGPSVCAPCLNPTLSVGSSLRFSWFPRARASPSWPVGSLLTCRVTAGKEGP